MEWGSGCQLTWVKPLCLACGREGYFTLGGAVLVDLWLVTGRSGNKHEERIQKRKEKKRKRPITLLLSQVGRIQYMLWATYGFGRYGVVCTLCLRPVWNALYMGLQAPSFQCLSTIPPPPGPEVNVPLPSSSAAAAATFNLTASGAQDRLGPGQAREKYDGILAGTRAGWNGPPMATETDGLAPS